MTKLDVLDGFETVKVCTGYWLDGHVLDELPRSLRAARPRSNRSTRRSTGGAACLNDTRSPASCRRQAQRFIELVEREVGVPVRVVGVGAERDDYLLWHGGVDDPALLHARDGRGLVGRRRASAAGSRSSCWRPRRTPTLGVVPAADAGTCRDRAPVVDDAFVDAVLEREAVTDHDVAAFVDVVQAAIGAAGGIVDPLRADVVSDVVDTALCWALRDAADLLIDAATDAARHAGRAGPRRTATR